MKRLDLTDKELESLNRRFWAKVIKSPDGCWGWSAMTHKGYGMIWAAPPGRNKIAGSRASWVVHFGDPKEMHVLHSCDNTICTNPDHLFLGTHADNMRDKEAKGRARPAGWLESVRANAKRRTRLTESYPLIRELHSNGATYRGLARMFDIDRCVIRRIIKTTPSQI